MRPLKVHVLDIGHGDTIILELPIGETGNYYGVIDCYKFQETKQYLDNLGVQELAFVCATHPHKDHILGIQKLLETFRGKVSEYWESGMEHSSDIYIDLLTYLINNPDIQVEKIRSGSSVRYDKVKLHILSPPIKLFRDLEESTNINNSSIVIQIEYGKTKILLSGDAHFGSWAHMRINHTDKLKSHALKVSHHGSKHGNFLEALEIVNPNYAIISAGERDISKFPHKYTLDSLKEIVDADKILNTKDSGNVIIKTTGTGRIWIE